MALLHLGPKTGETLFLMVQRIEWMWGEGRWHVYGVGLVGGVRASRVTYQGCHIHLYRLDTAQLQGDLTHVLGDVKEDIFVLDVNTVWNYMCFRI